MAFKTPVDARLIAAGDPSQFMAGAARDQARIEQSFKEMQAGIKSGVEQFEQKQQERKDTEMSLQLLKEFGLGGYSDDALKAGIKSAGGPTNFLKTLEEMQGMQTDQQLTMEKMRALQRPESPKLQQGTALEFLDPLSGESVTRQTSFSPETGQYYYTTPQGLAPVPTGARKPTSEAVRERDARVQDLMQTMNISRADALGIVEGTLKVQTDPVTGAKSIVNLTEQTVTPIGADLSAGTEGYREFLGLPPEDTSKPLYDMAEKATGIYPAAITGLQRLAGQSKMTVPEAPELVEQRQSLSTAQKMLGRAMAVNPRFSEGEQKRIMDEINISSGVFTDPVTLQAKMRSIDASLRQRARDELEASENLSLGDQNRKNAIKATNDIVNFLRILGVPQEEQGIAPAVPAPEGVNPQAWEVMTPEQRALWD